MGDFVTGVCPQRACADLPCLNGDCIALNETNSLRYMCSCLSEPFSGSGCQFFNECTTDPCLNGGECTPYNNIMSPAQYTCNCSEGFVGTRCQEIADLCSSQPCQQGGSCTQEGTSITCHCPPGFTGSLCQVDIDECASFPCENGGTCLSNTGTFICTCPPSHTGLRCELMTCNTGPCQNNGTCTSDQDNGYRCSCPVGTTGVNCEINVDECASNPCQNSATCIDHLGAFFCQCSPAYTGMLCEKEINFCANSPCNAGTCIPNTGGFSCACMAGFTGQTCSVDINECESNPCANGATCDNLINSFRCICLSGFSGDNCTENINDCNTSTCENGGTCFDQVNDFFCMCPAGFSGKRCEQQINFCISNPCLNGGNCSTIDSDFTCSCTSGWSGQRCQYPTSALSKLLSCQLSATNLISESFAFSPTQTIATSRLQLNRQDTLFISSWVWQEKNNAGKIFTVTGSVDGSKISVSFVTTTSRVMVSYSNPGNATQFAAFTNLDIQEARWHHFSLILTSSGFLSLAVDGNLLDSQQIGLNIGSFGDSTVYLGRDETTTVSSFLGVLRAVSIATTSASINHANVSTCLLSCSDQTFCQNNAQCLDFSNFREYHCQCPAGFTGLRCQYQHSTYSLSGASTVSFSQPAASLTSAELQFKTEQSSGQLITLSREGNSSTVVRLINDSLHLEHVSACNSSQTFSISSPTLKDLQWHSLKVGFSSSVTVQLDSQTAQTFNLSCRQLSTIDQVTLGTMQPEQSFAGCVRGVNVNGLPKSASDAQLTPSSRFGCTRDTVQFIGHSYLQLQNFSSPLSTNISFDFATYAENGIMYYGRRSPTESTGTQPLDFIAIHILNGSAALSFNLGESEAGIMITSSMAVNDGNWHHIEARQIGQTGTLLVDGSEMTDMSSGVLSMLNTDVVYVGGVPVSENGFHSYAGCIRDLEQNGTAVDLQQNLVAVNVHFGTCN